MKESMKTMLAGLSMGASFLNLWQRNRHGAGIARGAGENERKAGFGKGKHGKAKWGIRPLLRDGNKQIIRGSDGRPALGEPVWIR